MFVMQEKSGSAWWFGAFLQLTVIVDSVIDGFTAIIVSYNHTGMHLSFTWRKYVCGRPNAMFSAHCSLGMFCSQA